MCLGSSMPAARVVLQIAAESHAKRLGRAHVVLHLLLIVRADSAAAAVVSESHPSALPLTCSRGTQGMGPACLPAGPGMSAASMTASHHVGSLARGGLHLNRATTVLALSVVAVAVI